MILNLFFKLQESLIGLVGEANGRQLYAALHANIDVPEDVTSKQPKQPVFKSRFKGAKRGRK